MDHFNYVNHQAHCEGVPLADLAKEFGTPLFIYSQATLSRHCERLLNAFSSYPTVACFAVKANSNIEYLRQVFKQGLGADIVSIGELERCLLAGVDPKKVVFSGVGKRDDEIRRGLEVGLLSFNVESVFELESISRIAKEMDKVADIALRINPDIDAKTHPKISTGMHTTKFGMTEREALGLCGAILQDPHLNLVGLACHIGSQITDLLPLKDAAERMSQFAKNIMAEGHHLAFLNMGGGLGIRYRHEAPPELEAYANTLIKQVASTGLKLVIEPGRVVSGNSGVLLTKVIGVKQTPKKNFVIVDAAMTELVRPAFYGSYHEILPVKEADANLEARIFDVVGPVCESSDVLGEERHLIDPRPGDLLYIRGCGGYGATMASNYNSRPRPSEVMVTGREYKIVRKREPLDRLWELECLGD